MRVPESFEIDASEGDAMSGGQQKARQLIPLDWGQYLLLDGIIYRSAGASPSDKTSEILIPVDPNAHQMSRAVPITSRKMQPWKWVNPSALFFGQHAEMLLAMTARCGSDSNDTNLALVRCVRSK
ncbi:hypothetical protein [Gulosibacter sediminis]|uniref:hypothetical protein n=1 Tax=Gulosibacter sediminis TaxID=1729695 RepID=UPI0024ADB2BB|nr:hypothetical protein [Gulosibacter sediminis]